MIGENRAALTVLLGGSRPPTRVPVVYAMVRTALPTIESMTGVAAFVDNRQIFWAVDHSSAKYSFLGFGAMWRP